jgi:hypothetical protein
LEDFREGKRRIQSMFGLAGSKAAGYIQSRCKVEGTIERGSSVLQAAIISNRREKKESCGEQVTRPRKSSPQMNYDVGG